MSITVNFAPGEYVREIMEYWGMTQSDMAYRLGISEQEVKGILSHKLPITRHIAVQLSRQFGVCSETWLNLQRTYERKKRRETQNNGV